MLKVGSNGKVQTSPLPTFKISSIKWSKFKHMRLFSELGWLPGSAETQIGREWGQGVHPSRCNSPALGVCGFCRVGGTAELSLAAKDWRLFFCPESGAALQTLCLWARKHHCPPLASSDEKGSWNYGGVQVIITITTIPDIYRAVTT